MASKKTKPVERKLKSRRRKVSLGRVIRVSDLVFDTLNKRRGKLSWDCMLRRTLGLPDRYGTAPRVVEGMLEPRTGLLILRLGDVTWEELEQIVRKLSISVGRQRGWADSVSPSLAPIPMREIPRG